MCPHLRCPAGTWSHLLIRSVDGVGKCGTVRMSISLSACVRENHGFLFASGVFRSQQSKSKFPCTND